jgi:hypothetical protein
LRTTCAAFVLVECARHDLCSRWTSPKKLSRSVSAVRRVLPCCSVSLAASSHAVGFALEELSLPFPAEAGHWRLPFARLLTPLPPSPATSRISGPLMRFRTLQRVKPRAATATQHLGFPWYLRLAGITSPDSATPSGFLNLLTSYSARSPPDLVPCRWHSWVFHLRRFPLTGSRFRCLLPSGLPLCRFVGLLLDMHRFWPIHTPQLHPKIPSRRLRYRDLSIL